jgi:hypothetical protein
VIRAMMLLSGVWRSVDSLVGVIALEKDLLYSEVETVMFLKNVRMYLHGAET